MIKNIHMKYNLGIWLAIFCLVYNPPLLPFNSMHLVGGLSLVYLFMNYASTKRLLKSKHSMWAIGFFFVLTIYLFLVSTLFPKGNLETMYFSTYFIFDIIPFGLALLIYHDKKNLTVSDFYDLIIQVALVQAILAIAAFFLPEVQKIFVSMFINQGYGEAYAMLADHRLYGLAGTLTFSMPILQSFLAVCCFYKAFESDRIKNILLALVLFFSAVINARVSIVVMLVGVFSFFLSRISVLKKIILALGLVASFGLFVGVALPLLEAQDNNTFSWVLDGVKEILAFAKGENVGYFAYITNIDRYVLPNGIVSLMFGEGHSIMGGEKLYGVASDVGFINDIWRGGFVYLIVLYCFAFRALWTVYKNGERQISFIGLCALLAVPVLNFKGSIIRMNEFSVVLFLIYMLSNISFPQDDERSQL